MEFYQIFVKKCFYLIFKEHGMQTNRGVIYIGKGTVQVNSIDFPKFVNPKGKKLIMQCCSK